jgi:hypothetical protein
VILHNFHVLIMAAKRRNTIEVFQQYEWSVRQLLTHLCFGLTKRNNIIYSE